MGSDPEEIYYEAVKLTGFATGNFAGIPERQFRFCKNRRWVSDFAWPESKLIVEIEGGTWRGGRHTTGAGFEADCRKYLAASEHGYTVFRFTSGMVKSGEAVAATRRFLLGGGSVSPATSPCHPITPRKRRATKAAKAASGRGTKRRKKK